jgi:hypothetical protein
MIHQRIRIGLTKDELQKFEAAQAALGAESRRDLVLRLLAMFDGNDLDGFFRLIKHKAQSGFNTAELRSLRLLHAYLGFLLGYS